MNLKITFAILSLAIFSCGTIENQAPKNAEEKSAEIQAEQAADQKMMAEGFLPGRIIYSLDADDCQYTIQLKDAQTEFYYVDPINLDSNYNRDGQTVWVKFRALKRANRCDYANPVELTEIQNRN